MKTLKFSLVLLGLMLVPHFVSATLVGPYTPDANTLFLVHFDQSGSVAANLGIVGGNFITATNTTDGNGLASPPTVTTLLGQTSYSGGGVNFTNAVTCQNSDGLADGMVGFDGNQNGVYDGDVQNGQSSPDAISMTNLNIGVGAGNSPFTIEAIIKPTAIVTANHQEILCSDSYHTRGFQFRITKTGQLEFNDISMGAGNDFLATIPTSGPQAFVPGSWYHVAVVYDGSHLTLYWTSLDATNTAAHPLQTAVWNCTTAAAVTAPLVIGDENRGSCQEAFLGLIDEVRISDIARGPGDMEFNSAGVTIVKDPISQNIDNFMPVTFSVTASSSNPLSYQWRFDGTPIPNATNTSYTIASVQDTNAGTYDVVITNTAGYSATSSPPATLVVGAANFLAHRWSFTGDMTDSIGGANGTGNGTATVSGGALVLDGSSNCFMSLPAHLLQGVHAVTFDFWATLGTNGNNCRIFDFGNTNFSGGVGILPPENYVYFSPHTSGGTHDLGIAPGNQQSQVTLSAPGTLDNRTVHVTCILDPPDGVMSIYTNGVLEATNTLTVPLSSLDDQLCWIGRSLFTADAFLVGSINELRIFDGALSPASVLQDDVAGPDTLPYNGPVILAKQPTDAITVNGQPVTFSSSGIGHQPITYQWYENSSTISGATNADYTFTAATAQNGHTFHVAATNTVDGTNYYAVSTNATLTVVTPQSLTWSGVNGPSWDPTTLNWTNGTSLVAYGQYNEPVFSDYGISHPTVDVTQAMYMVSLTANNSSGNYVIGSSTQSGSLNGLATLTKSGAGKLTIDLANNLSGGALISGGTLQIGNADGSGTLGGGDITNNATLDFNRTNAVTVANIIHGTGTLQFDGTGSVALSGSNDYSGTTLVNAGTVNVRNPSSLGAATAGTTVAGGARIYIDQNVDVSEPLTLNGGMLQKGGAGLTTDYGAVTLGSASTLNVDGGATLDLTNSAGVSGGNALTLAGSGTGIIRGPLSLGGNSLTVSGGTWMVAPNNSYSGGTTINGGALQITGSGSLGSAGVSLGGGTLEAMTNITLSSGSQIINVASSSTIAVDSNATFTVANSMTVNSAATLTKGGAGKLILNGANSFLGVLNIDTASGTADDGMTEIANNSALSGMFAYAGTPSIFIRNLNAGTSTLALDGTSGSITVAPDISLAGRDNATPAIENLAGSNTISGNFTLAVGGSYNLQSDSGTLNITQPWPYLPPAGVTSARSLIFSGAGNITMTGAIQDGNNGGTNVPTQVTKIGTGTLNLPAANTYTASTIVSNGVVFLTGSISSTNGVFVAGGALAGNGIINDNVTVSSSSASGTIDALAVNGNFTINGPLTVDVNRTGSQSDDTTVSGGITNNGGSIVVNNLGPALQVNDQFFLFHKAVVNGANMTVSGGGVQWNNNLASDGSISVASIMATTPTNIVVNVTNNSLTLSWPPNYQGWILQAQTNTLSTGLSTNWHDVTGSGSLTNVTMTINPTNGTVFYRLRLPQ